MSECRKIELLPGALDGLYYMEAILHAKDKEKLYYSYISTLAAAELDLKGCDKVKVSPTLRLIIGLAKQEADNDYYKPYDDICSPCLGKMTVNKLYTGEDITDALKETIIRFSQHRHFTKNFCYICSWLDSMNDLLALGLDGITCDSISKDLGISVNDNQL